MQKPGGKIMKYISTRGNYKSVSASEAIRLGMVPEGGLFVPEIIPELSCEEIMNKKKASYQELVCWILNYFLGDYSKEEIERAVKLAYSQENFSTEKITPLRRLDDSTYIMELWHGPTAAFKDLALQILPYLLVEAMKKNEDDKEIVILVATSGDTGKAALEGFKDVEGVQIIVYYPEDGVSKIQEDQMLTTGGNNTEVVAVKGNFDDCQNAVKQIFADKRINRLLEKNDYQFSSANSINWGRLVPQIIYYFAGYFDLLRRNEIKEGEEINITVPTGNFGNILASYYAYRMGLPVNKFICASNDNKVLTDFLQTGVYDINRKFQKTISPSMDILISSNLERFLFEITGHNSQKIRKWYKQLEEEGRFEVDSITLNKIKQIFSGEYALETKVKEIIKSTYEDYDYLLDPHTGVGISSLQQYREKREQKCTTIVDSTANPYKFSKAVLKALEDEVTIKSIEDNYRVLDKLKERTGVEIHRALADLEKKQVKHHRSCEVNEVKKEIRDILDI